MLPQLPKRYTCLGVGVLAAFCFALYFRINLSVFQWLASRAVVDDNIYDGRKNRLWRDDGAVCATATVTVTTIVPGAGAFATHDPTGQYEREHSKWFDPLRNAAKYENLEKLLSSDQHLLVTETAQKFMTREGERDKKIKALYGLDTSKQWLDFIVGLDEDGMPPFTKFAQEYIWKHQNPPDCTKAKFLVMDKFPNDEAFGMGAIIQAISMNLNVALRTGYVLLYNTNEAPGEHFIEVPAMKNHPCKRSLDCIFQPISLCSNEYITEENSIRLPTMNTIPLEFIETPVWSVPPVFGQALREVYPDITVDALKYWWRSQAIAYLMRPNGETMSRLKAQRLNPKMNVGVTGSSKEAGALTTDISLPFPMPKGAFSMHVRHGDKLKEMRLIPFANYVHKAERFIAENPLGYRKVAFISSEDPEVLREAQQITRFSKEMVGKETYVDRTTFNRGWTWYWSEIPRINGGPEDQLKAFGNRTEMTIKWLLQLMIAVECDGMVGTRGSGWNRVLDSLRCIWLAHCKQPYIEVGDDIDWSFYSN